MNEKSAKLDTKEFQIPETVLSRDIETRVIQVIILYCLGKINGVGVMGGSLIDTLFGREGEQHVKGIHVKQDNKNHSVIVQIDINVDYGISIPQKTEEVQNNVVKEITRLTGLHVASVHVVVKGLIPPKENKLPSLLSQHLGEEE